MDDRPMTPRDEYPWWVKLGLWGLPTRGVVWLSAGLFAVGAGFVLALFFTAGNWRVLPVALVFAGAAVLHVSAIRWVDRHGSWPP
jgi:hypothetical protein